MARSIILICLLQLFAADHLAGASKSFGGYGGVENAAQAQQTIQDAAQQALEGAQQAVTGAMSTPATYEPAVGAGALSTPATYEPAVAALPTPATYEPAVPAAEGEASASASATPAQDGGGGYGGGSSSEPSSEPLNGLNEKAINDIIKEHNVFRAKEHVPPLTWNTTLAKFSQQYVETLKKDCKMVHSDSPYGENLMLGSGALSWKTTVDAWSDEKKSYNYGANTCEAGKMCGHYTAVVWKDTTSVGCGRVLCDNKDTMILCSYWPPGNYEDQRPY